MDSMLTVGQVAKFLNVSPRTVRVWDDEGTLPAIRLPSGHRRYRLPDVQARLELLTREWRQRDVPESDEFSE